MLTAYQLEERIRELQVQASENHRKANEEEQKVYARRKVIYELERATHESRARAGNLMSKRLLESPGKFDTVVDNRASADPIWRGHVANNQFFARKADMDNIQLQSLYFQRERLLNGSEGTN